MKLVQTFKNIAQKIANDIANAQASQEAFNQRLEEQVSKHGISAVSRASKPLDL
jgi:hypothetical protein